MPPLVAAAASSSGAAAPPPPAEQQQSKAALQELDLSNVRVTAEFEFAVEQHCTLRLRSALSGKAAGTAAVLAAALVALRRRERALDGALEAARRDFPGLLHPKVLESYDRQRAAGQSGAALAVLGFGSLQALASRVAPEAWRQVEGEMVKAAAELQSQALIPQRGAASEASSAGSADAGVRFALRPGFDLPSAVVALPQWEGWLRRLRDALVAWQQAQQVQQQASNAAGSGGGSQAAGAPPSSPAGATADAAPAQGSAPGSLAASFAIRGVSPGGLPMQQTLTLRVAAPEGRQLVQAVERMGLQLSLQLHPGLGGAAAAPEQQLQHSLEVAAFQCVRLPSACGFACTLHAAGGGAVAGPPAAGSAAGGDAGSRGSSDSGSSGRGSGAFSFEGSAYDLACMALALGWMVGGGADGATPPTPGQWYPSDGRLRFQRRGDGGGGWGWPARRQGMDDGEYALWVWPQQPATAPAAAAAAAPAGEEAEAGPAVAELSREQLEALMDCLDAFLALHPGHVMLPPLPPLQAPQPGLLQRLAGG